MKATADQWRLRWILGGLVLVSTAIGLVSWGVRNPALEGRAHGERKERWTGRTFAKQTEVHLQPTASSMAPGWDSERVWSGLDDWEPFVAADPSSTYVYQMTTRFNDTMSAVMIRASSDSGKTWGSAQFVAPVNEWQADPQVAVANDGTVYVVWLDGPDWRSRLVKSFDHGQTWTSPIDVAPALEWNDHPWLVISPDGKDVYIGLNENESYFVSSHDFGKSFGPPFRTGQTRGRWWLHASGTMDSAGNVYFAVINYPIDYYGSSGIYVISTLDHGVSWQKRLVDTSAMPFGCNWAEGCYYGFFSPTAAISVDKNGKFLLVYDANQTFREPQQLWVTTSIDGITWTPRMQISQLDAAASNAFPAVAAGPAPGDFRVVWQGNKDGDIDGWNTYFRQTIDGGVTWGSIIQLSDRSKGAPYKHRDGYVFPYGDYLGLSVDRDGVNHVIWGESISYDGPGGSWYTRGR